MAPVGLDRVGYERYLVDGKVDIAFWFAGERMRGLVQKRLLAPLDPEFVRTVVTKAVARAPLAGGVVDGQHYAFPVTYYPWGFFYRKSTFARLGLAPPQDWGSFLKVCEALKAASITPTAVGAQAGRPAAAWFDYLNLRSNGLEFHQKLLRGDIPFSDLRVRQVVDLWKTLLDRGFFLDKTVGTEWDSVLPFLYREQVGMVLLGVCRCQIRWQSFCRRHRFLRVSAHPGQSPRGESRATTHRFLAYLATEPALNVFNDAVATISPLAQGQASTDTLFRSSKAVLDATSGLSFYFDRDARADLIQPAFDAFKGFLRPPHDVDAAMRTITRSRR